jgi:hypothetical protein
VKSHGHSAVRKRSNFSRWLSLAGFAVLAACGGGGGASGTTPFGNGSGTTPLGSGAGNPPFGAGSGGGGTTGDGVRPAADPAVVVSNAALQGTVISTSTGSPVSGASIRFNAATLTSGADGGFSQLNAAADPRLVVGASAANYESLYLPTEVLGSVPSVNLMRLTPYGTTSDVTVATGATVTDTVSTAAVTVPASSLVAAGGGAAPAVVGVRVTQIAVGTDTHLLSGDYTDPNDDPLETYGGINISSSVPVDVASGQQLTLRIPVSSRTSAPPSVALLYRLEPVSGRWVQGGTAALSGGAYSGTVTATGQWMVGVAIAAPVVVTGCVNDDTGAPAADVRIEAEGITYSAISQATTDVQGQFTVSARPSSRVVVSGRRGVFLTNAASADIGTAAVNIPTCLTLPTSNAATMRLTWGATPSDIDSHLRTPDGSHVFFNSKGTLTQAPFSSLDVDNTIGFGPEVTTIRRPRAGIYRFYLHNYSRLTNASAPGMTGSPARLELNYLGRTVVFTPPPDEGGVQWWHLFDLEISSNCTMTLYRYNRWRADEPQNPNPSTTAAECIPS